MAQTETAKITEDFQEGRSLKGLYLGHKEILLGGSGVLAFGMVWELVARLGLVDPLFLSSPALIIARAVALFSSGEIFPHINVSAQEFLVGYCSGVVVGTGVGMLMGRVKWVKYALAPFVDALYASPLIVFLPLLIIWFGIGLPTRAILVFVGAVFPMLMNTYEGTVKTDPRLVEVARSFGARELDIFTKITIRAALPFIIAGLRLAIARSLVMIVVSEYFVSTAGLGYLLLTAGAVYDTNTLWAVIAMIAGFGVLSNVLIHKCEFRVAPWQHASRHK